MSLTRRVAHNTIIQIIGKTISIALGLLTIALMTRYLGQTGFGEYATITSFLQIAVVLVDLGLSLMLVQMLSKPGADEPTLTSNFLSLRFVSSLILLILAVFVAFLIPSYSQIIKFGIAISAFSFVFSAMTSVITGVFQKHLHLERVALAEAVNRLLLVAFILLAIYQKYSLFAFLIAIVIGNFVNFLLLFYFSRKFVKIKFQINPRIWLKILKTCWPVALSIAFNLVYFRADTLILSLVRSQAEVGIYGATYRVLEVAIMFPIMFVNLVLPFLTQTWAEKNLDKFQRIFQKSFDFLVLVSLPMITGALFLATPIMVFVAGSDFAPAGAVLKILIFATAIIFIASLFTHAVVALDKQKQMLKFYVLAAIVGLAGYLVFIPRYSYYGAAYMTIFAELILALAAYFVVTRATKIIPNFSIVYKSLLASVVMSIPLYFLSSLNLLLLIVMAIITYFLALYFFKGISREMIKEIVKLK